MQLSDQDVTAEQLEVAGLVGHAMARLFRAASRAKAHDAARGGDFHSVPLLLVLRESGALRSQELAECLHADPSTISRQVAVLVDRGLIAREPDPDDRRAARLVLTGAGQTALDERMAARQRYLAQMLAGWPMADSRELARLLGRFADEFAEHTAPSLNDPGANDPTVTQPAEPHS
jgi:DNA-binding MarR family transcriptional regulator